MNAWKDSQLAVIEEQLSDINLVPPVIDAFQRERLNVLQMLENGRLADLYRWSEPVFVPPAQPNGLQKLRKASYGLLALVPRGWVYQNMATIGSLHQGFLDAADGTNGVIDLRQIDAASRRVQEIGQQYRPETFLAAAAFPLFTRAWQTVARNQELVNEVLVECERERDRLAGVPYVDPSEPVNAEYATGISRNPSKVLPTSHQPAPNGQSLLLP
jgi:hypothetical protein